MRRARSAGTARRRSGTLASRTIVRHDEEYRTMVKRVAKEALAGNPGQNADMERVIAVSRDTVGSEKLYSSIVTTAPRRAHGDPPPRRVRDEHLHPRRPGALLLRRRAARHRGRGGRRLHLRAGVRGARRRERQRQRTARRAALAQLRRFGRPLRRRHAAPAGDSGSARQLAALLEAHGLAGVAEEPFEHTGFSGATLTRLVRDDGQAFVLKRMSHRARLDHAGDRRPRLPRSGVRRRARRAWATACGRPRSARLATATRTRC